MPMLSKNSESGGKIIQAASKLFASQGYHGTSTRQIAHLAEVAENTLFRQFAHKEELFWVTLRDHSSRFRLSRDLQDGLEQCEPPEIVLPKILDLFTDTARFKPEFFQMVAVAFLELHWKAELFGNDFLSPIMLQISGYLETNIKCGRIRGKDPAILMAALITTTLIHPEISRLICRDKSLYRDTQCAGREYSRFWLDLLAVKPSNAPPHRFGEY